MYFQIIASLHQLIFPLQCKNIYTLHITVSRGYYTHTEKKEITYKSIDHFDIIYTAKMSQI